MIFVEVDIRALICSGVYESVILLTLSETTSQSLRYAQPWLSQGPAPRLAAGHPHKTFTQ